MTPRAGAARLHRNRRRRHHRHAHDVPLGVAGAHRLLWRAGFGPRPGDLRRYARMTRRQAVLSLTRPRGAPHLIGPRPHVSDGTPLAPYDRYGHDHLWWLDRMVRSNQPLVERLTLIFHDWFATSNEKVDSQRQMIDQNNLLRRHALGSFGALFSAITADPAMLMWLDGVLNQAGDVNENYAREMMELFSLGAGRGAYSEHDVREQARALSGWTNDVSDQQGNYNFRFDPSLHDSEPKTIFGKTGRFDWRDSVRMCLTHPLHPSYFVAKLWSYFVPTPPRPSTAARLASTYVRSGHAIRPVVEAILLHRDFHHGPMLVKPPIVFTAGVLRGLRLGVFVDDWVGYADQTGQHLFYPPNVSGWTKDKWLDTSTYKGRWDAAATALTPRVLDPEATARRQPRGETASAALERARRDVGAPLLTRGSASLLLGYAHNGFAGQPQTPALSAMRRNALRQLILASPDYQVA